MPGIENNLYPPVCSTYMPAFDRTTSCKIYFSLSNYNSIEEIKNVQIVISNQNTNLSALAPGLYPAGIKISPLQIDASIEGDNKYFVTIEPEDLQSGVFELNQFYKVQLRFTGAGAETLTEQNKIAAWLVNNQQFFSEWSRVCLIKGIQKPSIYLKGFKEINEKEDAIFTSEVIDFVGGLYYEENNGLEKEYLKSYNIKIYNKSNNSIVYDSKEIYTNTYNPNEINYSLKTSLEDGIGYKIVLSYTTVNEYKDQISYLFSIVQNAVDSLEATIAATAEEELGRVRIDIVATVTEIFFGNLTIRRSSSESNFTIWEDIHEETIANGKVLNYTWYDYTIESGVWYKYCAQKKNSKGDRGIIINIRYPVMAVFDDMFLTRDGMQIKLKYNPTISSFKKTLLESKTDTLGSKYPIIRRNGNVGYRQFPISGLITAFCDEEGIFLNRENIYGDTIIYYDNYNNINNINEYRDFIYEREFREKIMDFLHENTIKLFRSTAEGNMLVKLMDISFTPNQTLGRMIYTFNATAYEIDDCTLDNFNKYGIQNLGKFNTFLKYVYDEVGQLQETYQAEQDILRMLQEIYSNKVTEKHINTVKYLKWIRIEFNMPPYLIKTAANGTVMPLPADEQPNEDTALGYIVYINHKSIIVSPRGFYELIDGDTNITSVYFPVKTSATIDYMINVELTENPRFVYNKMYFNTKVGQIIDMFNINENVFLKIYQKYYLDYVAYRQMLISLDKVVIEAIPGTIVYIKDSFDEDYFKHEIGPTGVLEFYDDDAIVEGLYFSGIQLYEEDSQQTRDEVRDSEFKEIEMEEINSLDEIDKPIKNGVYRVNGKRYIYYREEWFEFSDDNIVQCPVRALIDYIYELMKGVY